MKNSVISSLGLRLSSRGSINNDGRSGKSSSIISRYIDSSNSNVLYINSSTIEGGGLLPSSKGGYILLLLKTIGKLEERGGG